MIRKFSIIVLLMVLFLFICEGVGNNIYGRETWVYQPDSTGGIDVYIYGSSNYEKANILQLGCYVSGSDTIRTLITFPVLDSIPATAVIDSAKITFTYDSDMGTPPTECYVYLLLRNWVESQATWVIYSTGNNWEVVGAFGNNDVDKATSDTTTGLTWSGTDDVYITNCIRRIAGEDLDLTNYGLLIKSNAESGDNIGRWHSSDEGGSEPKITVYYTEGELTGILPKVYGGTIQRKVDAGTIIPKVRY